MAKTMVKTLFSYALMASATSLIGCSYEYHKERDQHMNLSTPSMVQTSTPSVDDMQVRPESPIVGQGQDMAVSPMPMQQPMMEPQPMPMVAPGNDMQMLGQPGGAPSYMTPNAETMPESRPVIIDNSYPSSR